MRGSNLLISITIDIVSFLPTWWAVYTMDNTAVRATLGCGLGHLAEWKSEENSLKEFPHYQAVYILTMSGLN
jgi:hypothetical protein